MAWVVLLASAVLEAVWASALGYSDGFGNVAASVVFVVALVASMAGLGWAAARIPIGTAYAVWTGIGAALTVSFSVISGAEPASPLKLLFLGGIVAGVVGLKVLPSRPSGRGVLAAFGGDEFRGVDEVRERRDLAVAVEGPQMDLGTTQPATARHREVDVDVCGDR